MPLPNSALIVGSDGFLGKNLVRYLMDAGWSVSAIGRSVGDLSDWATTEKAFRDAPKVDRIFHVVTRQRTGKIQFDIQGEMLAINARIHLNVLEAWRLHQPQAKLLSTGSSCAYPEINSALKESSYQTGPLHPSVTGYGLAKQVLGIGAGVYAAQYGLKHLHCILATLFGPGDHHAADRAHFVGGMLDRAVSEKKQGKDRFTVWGDPQTVREVLFVDDQIEAILAADASFENEILNCSANSPVTVMAVAQAICNSLDWPVPLWSPPESFQGAGYKVLDSSRFLDRTGWRPRFSLVDGFRLVYKLEYM